MNGKSLVAMTVLLLAWGVANEGRADPWNDYMRYLGWGWSDGYHASPHCGQISAAHKGHLDANRRHHRRYYGSGASRGGAYGPPRVVPGAIYGIPAAGQASVSPQIPNAAAPPRYWTPR